MNFLQLHKKSIFFIITSIFLLSACNSNKNSNNCSDVVFKAPKVAENGNVVPVGLLFNKPLLPGESVILNVDGEKAFELIAINNPVKSFTTRVRLSSGNIDGTIVCKDGKQHDFETMVSVTKVANSTQRNGDNSKKFKIKNKGSEIKMLFYNDMHSKEYIKRIQILNNKSVSADILLTPKISKKPYLGIKFLEVMDNIAVNVEQ